MASRFLLPTHESFEALLQSLTIPVGASEAHGVLSGLICGQGQQDYKKWFAILGDDQLQWDDLSEESQAVFTTVAVTTEKQILDNQFSFQLLLDDDDSLQEKTVNLGLWCQGFVSGLGLSGCYINQEADSEAGEALQDLAEVAKVNVEVSNSEEEERAFVEVLEYVRVAAVLIYQSVQIGHSQACSSTETVH